MLTRVVVGFVLIPVLLLVLYVAPPWVLPICLSLVSVLAVQELLGTTKYIKNKRVLIYAMIFAAAIPPWYYLVTAEWIPVAGLFVFFFVLFTEALIGGTTYENIAVVTTTSILLPFFFSSLVRIVGMDIGKYIIILPFIAAFISDTCALFVGIKFGKHKLAPEISPKKTVEGSIGGVIGTVLFMLAYGIFMQYLYHFNVNYLYLAIYGVLGSAVAQIGDLCMSLIKREFHIKDFGNILPGHGGIMDRFDSLLFTAPFIELALLFIPAVTK